MKEKLTQVQKRFKGGFSNEIVFSNSFVSYVGDGNCVCGYLGACRRQHKRDKIVEEELRNRGLGNEGVAAWLTSGEGRHLMDDVPKSLEEFRVRVQEYTKDAFIKVTVWSHPDHDGSLRSTQELKAKIAQEFERYKKGA